MLGQAPFPSESASLSLQAETDHAAVALSQNVLTWRSTRFLWKGIGLAALMLIGVSACAFLPLASRAPAKPSHLLPEVAFMPSGPGLRPGIGSSAARPVVRQPLSVPRMSIQAPARPLSIRTLTGPRPDPVLCDPVSKEAVLNQATWTGTVISGSSGERYPIKSAGAGAMYVDLVEQEPIKLDNVRDEFLNTFSAQTGMFRNPILPYLYERGWRQNFNRAGFPGIDKEFTEVQDFFSPANGGTVVDLSCGSGLMTRRLVQSQKYARVLAMDFSDEMLKETSRRFSSERIPKDTLMLVRADAGALPLQTSSVDAIHAGAAMHCWPKLEQSLAEVRRSLKPGGLFFASTFFTGALGPGSGGMQGTGSMYFFKDEAELNDLFQQAGFSEFHVRREGSGCAIIRAVA